MTAYQPRSIKRCRRTNEQLDDILSLTKSILAEYSQQITIRHLFYRLVGAGAIEKTEREYKNLGAQLTKWRRAGEIPWSEFVDSTRWYFGSRTYSDIEAALYNTAMTYRKDLWRHHDVHIELWTEKDAITSIVLETADSFGVKAFPCRGFTSLSSLAYAAETWRKHQEQGKDIFVYYFGDRDASGVAIDPAIERTLREDFGVEFTLTRVAITPEQIVEYNLPTRPQKKSDTRAKNFEGEAVEIDAMRPEVLCHLVEECITRHIDQHSWEQMKLTEAAEKESLYDLYMETPGEDEHEEGEE